MALCSEHSLNELQHEVRDKLRGSDDEGSRLIEGLGIVFNVTNLPHERRQSPENKIEIRSVST